MSQSATKTEILLVGDFAPATIEKLVGQYGLTTKWIVDGKPITGSYWGDPEAGVVGHCIYVRSDTPLHSMLHELCHIVCMHSDRRQSLDRDAGSDDLEECAVCYLQIVLANHFDGVGQARLMQDMDAWGYSFRLGNTQRWFEEDAADARSWLLAADLLDKTGKPQFRLRGPQ